MIDRSAQAELFRHAAMKKGDIANHFRITGATISGIALNKDFVKNMNPDVIIVEEAAEVLEVI